MGFVSMMEDNEDRINAAQYDLAEHHKRIHAQREAATQLDHVTQGPADAVKNEIHHALMKFDRNIAERKRQADELLELVGLIEKTDLIEADRVLALEAENRSLRAELERCQAATPPSCPPKRPQRNSRRNQRKQRHDANAGR